MSEKPKDGVEAMAGPAASNLKSSLLFFSAIVDLCGDYP